MKVSKRFAQIKKRNFISYLPSSSIQFNKLNSLSKFTREEYSLLNDVGFFQLVSLENTVLYDYHLDMAKKIVKRMSKKVGIFNTHVKAYNAYTSKPNEIRMGKGKGKIEGYLATIAKGQILFTLSYVPLQLGIEILTVLKKKLPVSIIIKRV
jgi:large subunit ribosomal protein L16